MKNNAKVHEKEHLQSFTYALHKIHYKIFRGIHITKEERKEEGSYSERKRKSLSHLSCATYAKKNI